MRLLKSLPVFILCGLMACVPARKLEETKAKQEAAEKELAALKTSSQSCETERTEIKRQLDENGKTITSLKRDTAIFGRSYRELTTKYDKLNELNEKLLEKYNKMLDMNTSDTKKISGELATTQEALLKKQDELKDLERELNAKKLKMDELSAQLQQREARVNELEAVLKKKDDAVNDLKKKVSDALTGFENKGLTITQKNGKIYVSLDESLLFASGSTVVEAKGVEALKKLAKVLEQNTDINVVVEGHTDDVPMVGKGEIKDNWDLSAMRATSIVKILTKNATIDQKRLTAAGRGEFFPIDAAKTPEARKKNRRTEIILTPKLDELFKVLETN